MTESSQMGKPVGLTIILMECMKYRGGNIGREWDMDEGDSTHLKIYVQSMRKGKKNV